MRTKMSHFLRFVVTGLSNRVADYSNSQLLYKTFIYFSLLEKQVSQQVIRKQANFNCILFVY